MDIIPVDEHITALDHNLMEVPHFGVSYVVRGEETAIIETGTSLTVEHILAGLDALGIARDAVGHILCTHIHMDHAGGAGYLAAALPRASVYIHSMTAAHLVDPARLLAGVRRAVGEELWPLHGDIKPIAPERLRPAEALRLDLGRDVVLEALPTPGHSPDHVAFRERRSGGVFIGDAASVSIPAYGLQFPPTPPPTYDYAAHTATLAMLRQQDISRFYLSHYSVYDDVRQLLHLTEERLHALAEMVGEALIRGEVDIAALAERWLPARGSGKQALFARTLGQMSVAGMLHYEKKRRDHVR